jgi:histidinol dehydrogenase
MEISACADWQRPDATQPLEMKEQVQTMLEQIEREGDAAITTFSQRFDGFEPCLIPLKPWREYDLEESFKDHLQVAAKRIRKFAELQASIYQDVEHEDEHGRFGHRVIALDSMAAYVPGGRFPLVSTALMTLIPAQVAGVPVRVAYSPSADEAILAAASLAGATGFVHLGGAQAIAAAAYGSQWAPAADMIVGPGNAYVNTAKALLQDRVKIDTLAGPSEILVLCDESIDPEWIVLDVLAQAEHDPMALSVLASTDREQLEAVRQGVERAKEARPDKDIGIIQLLFAESYEDMIELSNRMAPEHLFVAVKENTLDTNALRHYGSLFIGAHSAVALGDYCSGPNHTLPTLAVGRMKGGLQAGDFLKVVTFQEINPSSYNQLAETGIALAEREGLEYHRDSLIIRKQK